MSDTPETNDNIRYYLAPQMREEHAIVLAEFARKLERERDKALKSLAFIAEFGGKTHETECGDIRCDGGWCAEQARSAIYLLKENQ